MLSLKSNLFTLLLLNTRVNFLFVKKYKFKIFTFPDKKNILHCYGVTTQNRNFFSATLQLNFK
jgi:hypothetical protein